MDFNCHPGLPDFNRLSSVGFSGVVSLLIDLGESPNFFQNVLSRGFFLALFGPQNLLAFIPKVRRSPIPMCTYILLSLQIYATKLFSRKC